MDDKKINGLAMLLAMGIIVRQIVLVIIKQKENDKKVN